MGGKLYFDGDFNSTLTGSTVIGTNGSVFVMNGTLYVQGELEIMGDMIIGPSGKLVLAENTGKVCPEHLDSARCEDWLQCTGSHFLDGDQCSPCIACGDDQFEASTCTDMSNAECV
eukprot:COSAG02_NODE_33141_length_504_cov_9.948148_1_plen_115_part_10